MSVEELALLAGAAVDQIRTWARDESEPPTSEKLFRLLSATSD